MKLRKLIEIASRGYDPDAPKFLLDDADEGGRERADRDRR
jgi:hypothetical protein